MEIQGNVFWQGDDGYEQARQDAVWNARKPQRFPEVIVQAVSEDDVVAAVRLARERGLRVKARSGGHSWSASSVREGALLIDLSRLTGISFDPDTGIAAVQPGGRGRELNSTLAEHGLFFPTGHCPTVGVGGYLLQGGWGWNSRALGPACVSVVGVDVVTAQGELIHADETQNNDFLWAARGAGPGYFGVITRFHLRAHPRAKSMLASYYVYPLELMDEVLRWSLEIADEMAPELESAILGSNPRNPDGSLVPGPTAISINAVAMTDSEEEARDALAILETCPVLDRARVRETAFPVTLDELYDGANSTEPEGFRWAVDNMWSDASPDELLPAVRELFETVPTEVSHIFWYPWREQPIENAALSVWGKLYIAAFAGWTDPSEDERHVRWSTEQIRRLEPFSKGIQLADENLVNRNARYLAPENELRLERLRAEHDPDGLFHSYLTTAG
ncbi:MAG TPA: FAD-binding oxidoreductase [Thermoleophilaceae bacterium]